MQSTNAFLMNLPQEAVVVGRAGDGTLTQAQMRSMFELRYEVFHQKLGWAVSVTNRQERDEYDLIDPWYMLASQDAKTSGCWRLLPTLGPYMLSDTFSTLLRGESAPHADDIWELSRFAATSPSRRHKGQIFLGSLTCEMISGLVEFADLHGIRDYVTVTSVSVERLMKRIGIPMIRFGDGLSTQIGQTESVACWIPVNHQFRSAAEAATQYDRG